MGSDLLKVTTLGSSKISGRAKCSPAPLLPRRPLQWFPSCTTVIQWGTEIQIPPFALGIEALSVLRTGESAKIYQHVRLRCFGMRPQAALLPARPMLGATGGSLGSIFRTKIKKCANLFKIQVLYT